MRSVIMSAKIVLVNLSIVSAFAFSTSAFASITDMHKAVSHLFGSATAKATFQQCKVDGVTCQKFAVTVAGGMANHNYSVYVDEHKVGVFRTNSLGGGKMDLRTAAFIGASGAHPIPSGFPLL